MYEVTMPKLSDSMAVGKIIAWRVKQGDEVREGDVLAEIESDKAVMELECFHDGVVTSILHGDDDEVPVGELIAMITAKGAAPQPVKDEPEPEPPKPPEPEAAEPAPVAAPPKAPSPRAAPVGRVAISPYARKLATDRGIDWTALQGSGPGGRIVARDVERAPAGGAAIVHDATTAPAGRPPAAVAPPADEELPAIEVTEDEADVEPAPFMLKTLARRVTASKHVIPHFYVTASVDAARLLEKKTQLKADFGATVTHLVILACLKSLRKHPAINRSYDRGNVIKWKAVNIGLAVNTEKGLTVPVLRGAQDLTLRQIVERTGPLVEHARAGKLSADERRHPTFTITNLGMFGVEHFQPIINPPSAMTLAVASALPAPVIRGDAIYVSKVMKLTASCDHRIIDGVAAAQFLSHLTRLLENPEDLMGGD